jgi:hypothetical protein
MGLSTYLAFRTYALAFLGLLCVVAYQKSHDIRKTLALLAVTAIPLFIILTPWISFSLRHPAHVMARAKAVSIFNQNLPQTEVLKELWASSKLSFGMFLFTGDPNPRQNPSQQTMYDVFTVAAAGVGILFLFSKNKPLALAILILMIPSFVNDIFSCEFFPEFHYYGTGHPSATRTIGLIPLMLMLSTFGWYALDRMTFRSFHPSTAKRTGIIICLLVISGYINWSWYFQQPPSRFIYEANQVRMIDALTFANRAANLGETKIAMSKSFLNDQRMAYFINRNLTVIPIDIATDDASLAVIPTRVYTLLDVRTNPALDKELMKQDVVQQNNLIVRAIPTQWNFIDTLIVYRP